MSVKKIRTFGQVLIIKKLHTKHHDTKHQDTTNQSKNNSWNKQPHQRKTKHINTFKTNKIYGDE